MALFNRTKASGGDRRWLSTPHGLNDAKTVSGETASFATVAVSGVIPSGTALTITDGVAVPYDGATLSGFVVDDTPIVAADAEINLAAVLHGLIDGEFLPAQIAEPTDFGGFTFISTDWKAA